MSYCIWLSHMGSEDQLESSDLGGKPSPQSVPDLIFMAWHVFGPFTFKAIVDPGVVLHSPPQPHSSVWGVEAGVSGPGWVR